MDSTPKNNESAQLALLRVQTQVLMNELGRQWIVGRDLKKWAQQASKD